jgi:hypothetical protein
MDKNNKKQPVVRALPSSDKYILALKFVNQILTNIGKDQITELTQFVDINREDIINPKNLKTLDDMTEDLFVHFSKTKCGMYRRTDTMVLNCLRGMMKQMGHTFRIKQKDVNIVLENYKYRKTGTFYSII